MSRIGRHPVTVPAGVTVTCDQKSFTVKGPLGTLTQDFNPNIKMKIEGGTVTLSRDNDQKENRAMHGLYRALLQNMVTGVTKGFERALIVNGVGYKALMSGSSKLVLDVGFSHTVDVMIPAGVTVTCPTQNEVVVKGISKEAVGQTASNIRAVKVPDPYHLYGIRYKDEVIQKKEGKTAGK